MQPAPRSRLGRILFWGFAGLAFLVAALLWRGIILYRATFVRPDPWDLQVEAPRALVLGGKNLVHASLLDRDTGLPVAGVRVEARVSVPNEGEEPVASGTTDADGRVDLALDAAQLRAGRQDLIVRAGRAGEVRLGLCGERALRLLLATDKPLYQPSQTIHLRAWLMDTARGKPAAGEEATFEVEDAKGNKVFRRSIRTSDFGIAATDFLLADEVNQGAFKLRVKSGGTETEKTVEVRRYALPKFKVEVATDQGYYLPGTELRGTVDAGYFFGKPVSGARVAVTIARFVERFEPLAELTGKTDERGHFEFTCAVKSGDFQGTPLEAGDALMKIEAKVIDGAEHTEAKTVTRIVAHQAIRVRAVHESGVPVPGIENRWYVVATYPDGAPAAVRGTFRAGSVERDFVTGETGVAVVSYPPSPSASQPYYVRGDTSATIQVKDAQGRVGTHGFNDHRPGENAGQSWGADPERARRGADGPARFLLRTDKAFYRVGETFHLTLAAAEPGGRYHVDLVRGGQTVLTRVVKGSSRDLSLDLDLDAGHAGTLTVQAWRLLDTGHWARDRRVVYVDQPRDLHVEATLERETYKPGETASVQFSVSDSEGRPEPAALSLAVVDEAVFALSESQPGLEKVYFSLEKEILEPKYQIKTAPVSLAGLVRAGEPPPPPVQEAAVAALAAIELPALPDHASTYDARVQELEQERWERRSRYDDFLRWCALGGFVLGWILALLGFVLHPGVRFARAHGWAVAFGWWIGMPLSLFGILFLAGAIRARDATVFLMLAAWVVTLVAGAIVSWCTSARREARGAWWKGALAAGIPSVVIPALLVLWLATGGARMFTAATASLDSGAPPGADAASINTEFSLGGGGGGGAARGAAASPEQRKASVRVREHFPETLLWRPELITDDQGRARLSIPLADSITTWRMGVQAISRAGRMGGLDRGIRVFQDFFVDLDLPMSLTQGDEVHVPVAVYNYLAEPQSVDLELERQDWFECLDEPKKRVELAPNEVRAVRFGIRAKSFGVGKLTVFALGSKGFDDAIRRSIPILPDGERREHGFGNRLAGNMVETLEIPAEAIDGASGMWFKLYPGTFSQVVDGLDRMIQMPYG